jgi:toxin FitB
LTRYLLDTNVISETARTRPDVRVVRWISQLPAITLPAVAVYEVAAGIQRLPAGNKRDFLEQWFAEILASECEVLAFDEEAALSCAALESQARERRQSIEIRDLFILAIAKASGMGVATRNVAHFRGFGVAVYDPFNEVHLV